MQQFWIIPVSVARTMLYREEVHECSMEGCSCKAPVCGSVVVFVTCTQNCLACPDGKTDRIVNCQGRHCFCSYKHALTVMPPQLMNQA